MAGEHSDDPDERDETRGGRQDVADRKGLAKRVRAADESPGLLKAARALRKLVPGDAELGDPVAPAGEGPSEAIARRVAEVGQSRPSAARELSLGALQVWQSLSEAQGRGRGEVDLAILFTDLVDFSTWALEVGDETTIELLSQVTQVTEDAVRAAVTAAHDAARGVAAIDVAGYSSQLRAGVHVGRPRKLRGDYLGVDMNVAARIADAAGGGQLLVSATTLEQIDQAPFKVKRMRRFRAKGAPKDLEVYSLEPVA